MNPRWPALIGFVLLGVSAAGAPLRVQVSGPEGRLFATIADGQREILTPARGNASLSVTRAAESGPVTDAVTFTSAREATQSVEFSGGAAGALTLRDRYRRIGPELIERVVTVRASADTRYFLDLGWHVEVPGPFHSFTGEETKSAAYTPSCSGPEFGGGSMQTFPMLAVLSEGRVYGITGDTPGLWENRSFMAFDFESRNFSLSNGDGSATRAIQIPHEVDATSVYRAHFDGWQRIEAGQTQEWRSWIFASPARSHYDVQLAAHLALANALGFNHSGLEAILRNTSYLLLRRNLLRSESDYIFISGVGYGWKQWVSDGFWLSRGLDDARYDASAQAAVFFERINYEDNAQYYLIWAALAKRSGATLDPRTVDRAYRFIRQHEKDGLYIPPRLKPEWAHMKTYHDQLPYDDDDAPSSNQGFHCGALLAARELGYEVSDAEIAAAKEGFRRMFNESGGYFATSLKQQQHIGQDSLYGAVLTFAVFGERIVSDDLVRRHIETTMRVQSPYGMRVISKANGDLLEGHSGVYTNGGSWFLNDAGVYLAGLIHGMDPAWIDEKLLWRLEKELTTMPAFHESISTVDGHPHGHHLYSWNSGFWWLRREVRKRLGLEALDPLAAALDRELGVEEKDGLLVLNLARATLRPPTP